MKRSNLVDVFLVAALLIGATALLGFVRGVPESCPKPNPSSVEALFAPCLAADREDSIRTDMTAFDLLPPPPLRPGTVVAVRPPGAQPALREVEATGSLAQPKR
jgi:hypothetical protein